MAKKKDSNKIINEVVSQLLKMLGIEADFSFEETQDSISLNFDTRDSGVVIGYHGENLESLELILSLCIFKRLGVFKRVSIEVGDYKKNRSAWLENLAKDTKEKVLLENKETYLPDLRPWERRVIHLIFQDDKEVASESVGEGRQRTLVIKPR